MKTLILLTLFVCFGSINLYAADLNVKITPPSAITCNGKIDLTILGGYPPYDIVWTNQNGILKQFSGSNGNDGYEDLTNLCSDIQYCISITDAACGVLNYCWKLQECDPINVNAVLSIYPPSSCIAMDGSVRILSVHYQGGQGPYKIYIEDQYGNKYIANNNNFLGNLKSGKYYIVAEDIKGCRGYYPFDLIPEEGFFVNLNSIQHTCPGANFGRISIYCTSSDPNETYNYNWSNGVSHMNIPELEESILENLTSGTYCVTVTSNSTSCEYIDCYHIKDNSGSPLMMSTNLQMPCKNQRNGKLNLKVNGGTLPYTYNWDPPGTQPYFGLYAGTYCVTVTDFCGSSINECFELKDVEYELKYGITCKDEGWGEIIPTNATIPISVTWFENGRGIIGHGTRIDHLSDGNYLVFGNDANGCPFNYSFEIKYIVKNYISFLRNNSNCTADSYSGDGEIQIGSIDNRIYTFNWEGPSGFSSSERNISMLRPGNYRVSITDPDGCVEILEQIICCCSATNTDYPACQGFENQLNIVTDEKATSDDSNCDGFIHLTVTGGKQPYYYSWEGPNSFKSSLKDIDNICKGNYCVTVSDGCNSKIWCGFIPSCSDKNIQGNGIIVHTCPDFNTGSIMLNPSGGKPEYKYEWIGPDGFRSTQKELFSLKPGLYIVSITDEHKCKIVENYRVLENIVWYPERGCEDSRPCDICKICPNQYRNYIVVKRVNVIRKVDPFSCQYKDVCEDDPSITISGPFDDEFEYEWSTNENDCSVIGKCKRNPDITKTIQGSITGPFQYKGKIANKNGPGRHCYYCFTSLVCTVNVPENETPMKRFYGIQHHSYAIRNSEPCPNDPTKCFFEVYLCDDILPFDAFCTGDAYYCNPSLSTDPGELICGVGDIKPIRKDTIINGQQTFIHYYSGHIDKEMENYILNGDSRMNKINKPIGNISTLETFCTHCKDDNLEIFRYNLLGQILEKNLVQNNVKDLNNSIYNSSYDHNGVQFISVYCKSTKKSLIIKQIY